MSVIKPKCLLPAMIVMVLAFMIEARAQYDPVEIRIERLGFRVDSLVVVHKELARLRAGMLVRSSDLSARIDRLRSDSDRPLGPLDKYRLSSALALSQRLADSLDLANVRIDGLQQEIDGLRLDAVAACTAALDSLSRLMKDSPAGPRGILATRFERLREHRQMFASVDSDDGPEEQASDERRMSLGELAGLVKILPHDSPEEIAEKSAFLTDIETRWSRALKALEHSIGRLDEEHAMRGRMGEFTQELALFDQTGPSSRAARVQGPVNDDVPERSDGDAQPSFGQESSYPDYSMNAKQMAESISLDIELADPETELRLIHELDRFSNVDITDLAALLRVRRDSLAADLDSLRYLQENLNRKADLD